MKIRIATQSDAQAIARLYVILANQMAQLDPTTIQPPAMAQPDYFADYIDDDASDVLLAVNADDAPVGFALVVTANTGEAPEVVYHQFAFVIALTVLPDDRHQGIGSALLATVDDWANARHLDFVQLNALAANQNALAFYQHVGFVPSQVMLKKPLAK